VKKQCILSIDQGTTSSRAIVFDKSANIISVAQKEFPQIYPADGWVEHNPEDIWTTSLWAARTAFAEAETKGCRVVAIGITNQRETSIVWDRTTDKAIYNAIVWQDRRTAPQCRALFNAGHEATVQAKTGLLLDPYFSASKVAWILDNVPGARTQAKAGALAFGTVDSFLIWRLTGGQSHATDASNASRTSLFNIATQAWDDDLLALFNVPHSLLPTVLDSADDYGMTEPAIFGRAVPIFGVAGDQQAAAIGQCCFDEGSSKSTLGTGCFVLMNIGTQMRLSKNRLLTTVAYRIGGKTTYALEGSIFVAGAAVQWLRDGLNIVGSAAETHAMAQSLDHNHGVYMVPAFTGLGAPHWDPDARASVFGLTRATGRAALVRAALEAVCYQSHDLFAAMAEDGTVPTRLRVDGGMAANDWLLGYMADILDLPVDRPAVMETTALGAAYLAGTRAGIYASLSDVAANWKRSAHYESTMPNNERRALLAKWHKAVDCTKAFSA